MKNTENKIKLINKSTPFILTLPTHSQKQSNTNNGLYIERSNAVQ